MNTHTTLMLTSDEADAFARLSDDLREGWTVEPVGTLHEETTEELSFRLRMAHVNDPTLRAMIDGLKASADPAAAAVTLDFASLSREALGELCFVLGVRALSAMIAHVIATADSDADLDGLVGLTYLRSALSEANTPSA